MGLLDIAIAGTRRAGQLALAACLGAAAPAVAQQGPAIVAPPAAVERGTDEAAMPSAAVALAGDAAAYAALADVPEAEAARRLVLQEASVPLTDALRAQYRDRLAGIAIEQRPDFHLVVLLTGDAPEPDQLVEAGGEVVAVTFRTGAPATLDRLGTALATRQAAIRAALAHPPGMGIDQRTGALVVVVAGTDLDVEGAAPLAERLAVVAGVPVRVRSIDRPDVDQNGAGGGAEGGARLIGGNPGDARRYLCTAGFAVTDGERTGLSTAAHCPDQLSYVDAGHREHPLPFVGQWGWGNQDVQINLGDEPLAPRFHPDAAALVSRPVLAQRDAAGMRAGDVVCHRGERTGYSCAAVELTSFAPAGDLCGGACLPTWVTVAGPRCGGGDSGSPVFVGATALGLLKGGSYRADGSCGFYFYMPLDYLPAGWRLLTVAEAERQAAQPSAM